jgi:hypothetical protein
VIVVSGRESEDKLSQGAAEAVELSIVSNISAEITPRSFIGPLSSPSESQRQDGKKVTTNEV